MNWQFLKGLFAKEFDSWCALRSICDCKRRVTLTLKNFMANSSLPNMHLRVVANGCSLDDI
jgi:hypothetical protein